MVGVAYAVLNCDSDDGMKVRMYFAVGLSPCEQWFLLRGSVLFYIFAVAFSVHKPSLDAMMNEGGRDCAFLILYGFLSLEIRKVLFISSMSVFTRFLRGRS